MDRKDRGISAAVAVVRNGVVIVWVIFSSVLYGSAAVFVGIVSRPWARGIARLWCLNLLFVTGVKVRVKGIEYIDKNKHYVFVANHQSYFDIPVLYAALGSQLGFIAKKELFKIPFFGWGMRAIGCINLDRENPRRARTSITKAVLILKKNNVSLALFPEGTRSASGKVAPFKRASFTLALEAGVPIVPVAICGTRSIQKKESLRIVSAEIILVVCPPLSSEVDKEQISGMSREMILKAMEEI